MKLAATCLAACILSTAASAQTVIDLGRLPAGTFTFPSTLSDNGDAVVGSGDVGGGSPRAWRWTASGLVNLGIPAGANHSYGYGISGNGLVVIGAAGNNAYDTACRWTQGGGMQSLGSIAPGQPSFASDASFDGSIVFGYGYLANSEESAFRWTTGAGVQHFGQRLPGTHQSVGLGVNGTGTAYVGYCYNNAPALIYPTACAWNASGTITSLGVLAGSTMSVPGDLSADGSVVVGYAADGAGGNSRAFKWTVASGMQSLGMPTWSTQSVAGSITGDGSTIVGYGFDAGQARACIWVGSSAPIALDTYLQGIGIPTIGWSFQSAAISSDGSALSGPGTHNGLASAWYVRLTCNGAPNITQQPQNLVVVENAPAVFSVVASGVGIHYQWSKNTVEIPFATGSAYSIAAAALADAGNYSCSLTSACGNLITSTATLTVQSGCPVPVIVTQPADATVPAGDSASLQVSVTSDSEPHFQWRKDNSDLTGAIDARLDFEHVTTAEVGAYECVITNACGDAISRTALVRNCNADFNADGFVTGDDFDSYVTAFELGDPAADFDRDSFVTGDDFDKFVAAFESGC